MNNRFFNDFLEGNQKTNAAKWTGNHTKIYVNHYYLIT